MISFIVSMLLPFYPYIGIFIYLNFFNNNQVSFIITTTREILLLLLLFTSQNNLFHNFFGDHIE